MAAVNENSLQRTREVTGQDLEPADCLDYVFDAIRQTEAEILIDPSGCKIF